MLDENRFDARATKRARESLLLVFPISVSCRRKRGGEKGMERKKLRSSIPRNDEGVGRRKMEQERERKKERKRGEGYSEDIPKGN